MKDQQLLTVEEAAQMLGVKRTFVFSLLRNGDLARLKLGRLTRIAARDLATYVDRLEDMAKGTDEELRRREGTGMRGAR